MHQGLAGLNEIIGGVEWTQLRLLTVRAYRFCAPTDSAADGRHGAAVDRSRLRIAGPLRWVPLCQPQGKDDPFSPAFTPWMTALRPVIDDVTVPFIDAARSRLAAGIACRAPAISSAI